MSDLDLVTNRIRDAFSKLYPSGNIIVEATEDETYEVTIHDAISFTASIDSDDDGSLYFFIGGNEAPEMPCVRVFLGDLDLNGEG